MMSKWVVRIIQVLVALMLPVLLLLGNIQLLAHPRFVHYEYGKAGFPADTAIPIGAYPMLTVERKALAESALRSIIGAEGMRALEEARFQETGEAAFNAREIRHMRDVRWLFQRARLVFWVAAVVLFGGGALLFWQGNRTAQGYATLTRPVLTSVVATLSVAGAIGLYILLNFGQLFTRFHHVFFEGDTWLFRRDDTLIRLFPTDFWFDAALTIAVLMIVELCLVGAGTWWWMRKKTDANPL
jgi:integral membrane protein (TIGR01906 family)